MAIKDWNLDDRPREKLIENGPEVCSVAELIAILITNGTSKKSAVELGREIMALANNNLINFTRLSKNDIESIEGIGPAKSSIIRAAQELGRRITASNMTTEKKLTSPTEVVEYMRFLREYTHEEFWAIYCNNSLKVLDYKCVSKGTGGEVTVDFKEILKRAFDLNATRIILCHNHPGGTNRPSREDIDLTNSLNNICKALNIKIVEHIIIAGDSYFSFLDEGLLN